MPTVYQHAAARRDLVEQCVYRQKRLDWTRQSGSWPTPKRASTIWPVSL